MNDEMNDEERLQQQKIYLEERARILKFGKFLLNETDVGALDCKGLINTTELAEQILPYFGKEKQK